MRDFPQEVIDHIFDYFRDDRPTLAALSLVCWNWNHSSRIHFFRSVELSLPYTRPLKTRGDHVGQSVPLKKYERLVAIINRKSVVASLIREVIITYNGVPGSSRWRVAELVFTGVLEILERVHTLNLCQIHWSQLGAGFQTALFKILSSSNLLQLNLRSCSFSRTKDLTNIIGCAPGLRTLTMASVHVDGMSLLLEERALHIAEATGDPCLLSSKPGQRASLRKLAIETTMIATWLPFLRDPVLCPIDVSCVNDVYLSQVDDIKAVDHYIQATGSNLVSLEMWAPSPPELLACGQGAVDLSYTPKLRSLRILGLPWSVNLCPGICLTKMLDNISTLHPLEDVHVLINIVKNESEGLDWDKWRALDECLTRPVFYSLRKCEIVVALASSGPRSVNLEQFRSQFPSLNARRLLTVRRM